MGRLQSLITNHPQTFHIFREILSASFHIICISPFCPSAHKPQVWKGRFLWEAGEAGRGLIRYSLQRKEQVSSVCMSNHCLIHSVFLMDSHSCRQWILQLDMKLEQSNEWNGRAITAADYRLMHMWDFSKTLLCIGSMGFLCLVLFFQVLLIKSQEMKFTHCKHVKLHTLIFSVMMLFCFAPHYNSFDWWAVIPWPCTRVSVRCS